MNKIKCKYLSFLISLVLLITLLSGARPVLAATAPSLGAAQSFLVLGGSTVTNTGSTVVNGNLGVWPGTAVTGFPPGIVVPPGTIHAADAVAQQAQSDVTIAYVLLAGQAPDITYSSGQDLGGLVLTPGVYHVTGSAGLTGTLTLNAQGNPNSVFIFQIDSALTTASSSRVLMTNGGSYCNVFWQVGSSATLGTTTAFGGNILALTSITLTTGATVSGRALARNGAVTLDTNTVFAPVCPLASVPSIGVVKSAVLDMTVVAPNNQASVGDKINYTFVVTNTGNAALTNVTVSDIPALTAGPTPASVASLAAGAITTFTGSYTLTQADINAGLVTDNATATGTPPTGGNVTGLDSKTVNLGQGPASISLVKNGILDMTVVSPNNQVNIGDKINYTFVVTNTGSVSLTNVTVSDIPALTTGPTPASVASLAAGAITTFTGSYTLNQADINAGLVTDNATATGTPPTGGNVTGLDSKTVNLSQAPSISLVKNGVLDMTIVSPYNQANIGDKVNYSFTVTNTGNVALTNVTVIDPNITVTGGPIANLGPGASDTTTFTGSHVLTQADIIAGHVLNTAVVVGTATTGPVTDIKTKSVSLTPLAVGVEVFPVNKIDLLKASVNNNHFFIMSVVLAGILVIGGGILALRRRRTH